MRRLLLDSHALLWFIAGDSKLSSSARLLIEDASNEKHISIASVWEIGIKFSTGKLILHAPFSQIFPAQLQANGFELLPIAIPHIDQLVQLPYHHRDPFDRIIAAQSITEQMPLVSADAVFDRYGVTRLW